MPTSGLPRSAILRLAAFTCFTALSATLIQVAIRHGLRQVGTGDFGVMNRVVSGRAAADLLITGSSRALVHYDTRVLGPVTGLSPLNLGRNGSHTGLQLAVLRTHLRHNPAPRLLIHNLDLHSLASPAGIYDRGLYLPYLDEPAIREEVRSVHPEALVWALLPLYGHAVADPRLRWIEGLARLAGYERPETRFAGFEPRPWAWTGEFDRFAASTSTGYRVAHDSRGRESLLGLLRLCRDHGIPVVLVLSPEYVAVRTLQQNRTEILSEFAALAKEAGVPFWDFSDSPICGQRGLFYNSQHLNAEGAAAFSAELARRLLAAGFTATRLANRP